MLIAEQCMQGSPKEQATRDTKKQSIMHRLKKKLKFETNCFQIKIFYSLKEAEKYNYNLILKSSPP